MITAGQRPSPDFWHPTRHLTGRAAGLHRALQHSSPAPVAASAAARRRHFPTVHSCSPAAATRSTRRPGTRVCAGRM